jgi:FKBP-type peptidyl-prolyl cis-trans isomerase 2
MPIKNGDEVKIHYVAKFQDGRIVENTYNDEAQSFKIGQHVLLPVLEDNLIGLKKGDKKEITISPDKAFGKKKENLIQEVPKSIFKNGISENSPGDVVEMTSEDGNRILATIRELKKNSVILDLNHPLAGETITYNMEVIDIK